MKFKEIDNTIDLIQYKDQCVQEDVIYVKPGVYAMSSRKIESLIKIAYLQKYFQCNPVSFINIMFNIELLDAQAWIVQQSWTCRMYCLSVVEDSENLRLSTLLSWQRTCCLITIGHILPVALVVRLNKLLQHWNGWLMTTLIQ